MNVRLRLLIPTLAGLILALPTAASAEDKDVLGGFGGTVIYENAVGGGSFTAGAANNPYYGMSLSIRPRYTILKEHSLTLSARIDISTTIVEPFESSNTEPHDIRVSDARLTLGYGKFVNVGDGLFTMFTSFGLRFPTSLTSQFSHKILSLAGSISAGVKPTEWLSFGVGIGVLKNFNRFTNVVLDASDFSVPIVTRADGNEEVGEALVATGGGISEWIVNPSASVTFTFLEKFSVDIGFSYAAYFQYATDSQKLDEFSSPNATEGRGIAELMTGTIEIGYQVLPYLGLALGTSTDQSPLSSDNSDFRFPFWDTTNGASNRQTFYFDVAGTF
jgi:hypothetical protein